MPGYVWGAPVRHVFAVAAERGYALAAALHAPSAEEAFAAICADCGVPDEHAAHLQLAVSIRPIGPWLFSQRCSRRSPR